MENLTLDISLLYIIVMVLIAKLINRKYKVPLAHSLLILAFSFHSLGLIKIFHDENIVPTLFFLIPIIFLVDILHLRVADVKKYSKEIFLLAVVGVVLTVLMTAFMAQYFNILGLGVSFVAYFTISIILTATDAISVSNIMSQFNNISKETQVLIEGDSLGNDGTTIVMFYFIALPALALINIDEGIVLQDIPITTMKILFLSSAIGLFVGFLGFILLKQFKTRYEELFITIAVSYAAFVIAEALHVAGVLALIIAVFTYNELILKDIDNIVKDSKVDHKKEIEKDIKNYPNKKLRRNYFSEMRFYKKLATSAEAHKETVSLIGDLGFIAVTVLFVALAEIINPSELIKYKTEILCFFLFSTIARGLTMFFFHSASYLIDIIRLGFSKWFILTLAGIKGGLSVIMMFSIPVDYPLVEMFHAITMGVILLSTFVYGLILLFYVTKKSWKSI